MSETVWEKATAAHVYCAQGRIRGERYARHWHDLAAIARSVYFDEVASDRAVSTMVARHKSIFYIEKDASGSVIDYANAAQGQLRLVPEGDARKALADDYGAMLNDAILLGDAVTFDQLIQTCADIEGEINRRAA